MKVVNLLFLFFLFLSSNPYSAQTFYSVNYKSDAKIKVFIAKYKSDAKFPIFFFDYKSDADSVIFFADYTSDAGWENAGKKHLLY